MLSPIKVTTPFDGAVATVSGSGGSGGGGSPPSSAVTFTRIAEEYCPDQSAPASQTMCLFTPAEMPLPASPLKVEGVRLYVFPLFVENVTDTPHADVAARS